MIRNFINSIQSGIPLLLLAVLFFTLGSLQAQEENLAEVYVEQGEIVLRDQPEAWFNAMDLFKLALQEDPDNIKANYILAKLYQENIERGKSVPYLLKVYELDPDYTFHLLYLIGLGYHYQTEFQTAIDYYVKYRQKLESSPNYRGEDKVALKTVERKIYECQNGIEFKNNPFNYSIVNVGTRINSNWPDYGPVLNEDETIMIFTSRRQEGNINENVDQDNFYFEDIFVSRKVNGEWTRAENIGEMVNTPFHDSNLALSADASELYLYKDDNAGDIYVSQLVSDYRSDSMVWTEPLSISDNINSENFKEGSISISPDKNLLFFASDRPGGYGGLDIYLCRKDSRGRWGKSENLGNKINTEFDDEGPFIDYDGVTLYFSSKGRKGMGGYDIFKTEYDSSKQEWSDPENMGYPINTPDDDVFFVSTKDGKRGYYASVRDDGMGFTDIYMISIGDNQQNNNENSNKEKEKKKLAAIETGGEFKKNTNIQGVDVKKAEDAPYDDSDNEEITEPDPPALVPVTLLVKVVDADNNRPVNATLKLISEKERIEFPARRQADGLYEFNIKQSEAKSYMLSAEMAGYAFKNFKVQLPAAKAAKQQFKRLIEMSPIRQGYRSVLRNIYFETGSSKFTTESYNELNKLEKMMNENPSIQVEIAGHTDNTGPADFNKTLSVRRAQAVVRYLENKGIDRRRMKSVGYGEERPLVSNDDEREGREYNRRVEFKVLK